MEEKVWTKPEIVVLDVNEGTESKPNLGLDGDQMAS